MSKQSTSQASLKETENQFAADLLAIVQSILDNSSRGALKDTPLLFPNGISSLDMSADIEPTRISLSVKITSGPPRSNAAIARAMADLSPLSIADDILTYCISLAAAGDPVMADCNKFVKKVGAQFGVAIPDLDADGIIDSFNASPFTQTTMDPAVAMSWAQNGLVIAGMKLSDLNPTYGTQYDHGHVAVVHAAADPLHPGFPMASWGRLGGGGAANTSIRRSFPAAACDDRAVRFAFAQTG